MLIQTYKSHRLSLVLIPECLRCYQTDNIHVVGIDSDLFMEGLALYQSRSDKMWGLTDCLSFVVMQTQNLTEAMTADHHFVQAGFRALMLDP
jgi:uncharacterized protein